MEIYKKLVESLIGEEIAGSEFNELFSNQTFIKLTNETENHNGFQFVDGLNIDTIDFNPNGQCQSGGIYFTHSTLMHKWIGYAPDNIMRYIRKVIIPDDARIYIEKYKFKADKIILCQRVEI